MITSLTNIEESTDALSKGLLGFKMNLNCFDPTTNGMEWEGNPIYTYPNQGEGVPKPWITVDSITDVGGNASAEPTNVETNAPNQDFPVFTYCSMAPWWNDGGWWCQLDSIPWNGTDETNPATGGGTCAHSGWGIKNFPCSSNECLKCQYVDAINCSTSLNTGSDNYCISDKFGGVGCFTCHDGPTKTLPYAIGYAIKNDMNAYHGSTGNAVPHCGVGTQTHQYIGNIPWNNWLIGTHFFGARTISGDDGLPVFGIDYILAECNRKYLSLGCTGGYCDKGTNYDGLSISGPTQVDRANMNKKDGWIPSFVDPTDKSTWPDSASFTTQPGCLHGEWTFPLTTQNTTDKSTTFQDTINSFSQEGPSVFCTGGSVGINEHSLQADQKALASPPKLLTGFYVGLGYWLNDMLKEITDYKIGFLRDYIIIKTFASVYCTCLYGDTTTTADSLSTIRGQWFTSNENTPWDNSSWLTGNGAPFGNVLLNPPFTSTGSSYAKIIALFPEFPFSTPLMQLTNYKNFHVGSRGVVTLTVPVDGFRMKNLLNSNNTVNSDKFKAQILQPLCGETKKSAQLGLGKTILVTYTGIGYSSQSIFTTTTKTNENNYIGTATPIVFDPTDYNTNTLWPNKTHAWIQDGGLVASSGTGTPLIEAFYNITVTITYWSPGLALLFLTSVDQNRTNVTDQSPDMIPVLKIFWKIRDTFQLFI